MFIKPSPDRVRFKENLAAGMAATGKPPSQIASDAGLTEAALQEIIITGVATDEQIAALAPKLGTDPATLAPILDFRDPDRGDRLPAEGREVPDSEFWQRRLSDGDVVPAAAPARQDAPKPEPVPEPPRTETPA